MSNCVINLSEWPRHLRCRSAAARLLRLVKVKWPRYRPGVAQRVGRGIALLFHDRGTRRGWVVSSTPLPHFTPGKDPVPIVQEAGWAAGPVWTGGKSRPHWDSIRDRPARSQSLYRLSYPAHRLLRLWVQIPPGAWMFICNECCVCCQVEVSATSWSLVQSSPIDCGESLCVI